LDFRPLDQLVGGSSLLEIERSLDAAAIRSARVLQSTIDGVVASLEALD